MSVWHRSLLLLVILALSAAVAAAQPRQRPIAAPAPILAVGGEVAKPVSFLATDIAKLPRQKVMVPDQQGKDTTYEGVSLTDVLKQAGVEFGTMLKGNSLGLYVVASAPDGFKVVFALPELDPAFTDRMVIVADKQNGRPLDPMQGPLRLVVPGEKRPARWIRQVNTITVQRAP